MSNTFYCQLRVQDVELKKCERYRLSVKNGIPVEPCQECVDADLWRQYQESSDMVVIEPAKLPEPKRGPQPKPEVMPKKSEPIVEAAKALMKRCGYGAILGDGNTTGKCKTCYSREKNYRKGLKCSNCGKPITDYSKTGLCIHCSASRGQEKTMKQMEPETQSITVEANENQYAQPVPEPVETVVQMQLMPPESLGAAKIAIDRAFQDAERYREIRSLLQDLVDMEENRKATMTRIRELVA